MTVEQRLFALGPSFNFFQAVRLLERLHPGRGAVGDHGPPGEIVRFAAHLSHNFPPSQIYEIRRDPTGRLPPVMSVAFFGLTGPSGVLPRHYTDLLMRIRRDVKHSEKHALCDWFDLFTHRMLALFFRSWKKYRFYVAYERGEYARQPPDPFTHCLLSLTGLGWVAWQSHPRQRDRRGAAGSRWRRLLPWPARSLRQPIGCSKRLRHRRPARGPDSNEQTLAHVEDAAILHYAGLMARRPRTAAGLGRDARRLFPGAGRGAAVSRTMAAT